MYQIVTIGREFGSGGKSIGLRLAEQMGVKCYEKELLTEASKSSGLSTEVFETHDETPVNSFFYSLISSDVSGMGGYHSFVDMPLNQKVFLAQFDTIQNIAKKEESCVFVGRCADYALEQFSGVTNVFICADLEDRVRRVAERFRLSKDKAIEMIAKTDKKRASYYNYYSSKKWGVASTYDLTLNSTRLGIEGCMELIIRFLDLRHVKENDDR